MHAAELAAAHPVLSRMTSLSPLRGSRIASSPPWRVRPALLVALALSLLLHLAWSMWPVEPAVVSEGTVLTATLTQMPPPPVPTAEPPPAPVAARSPVPKARAKARRIEQPVITAATRSVMTGADAPPSPEASPDRQSAAATPGGGASIATPSDASSAPDAIAAPPVVLPPRLDLAYKVFFGTRGFMIGDATYRFEHAGDRYKISTIAQARGLAALLVHGTGKVESRGRITPEGLKPYEFAIERGSPDQREVAFFDWDAGNVVLHDGAIAQLDAPAFDPLTILWQPYFSPPNRDDQTFSLATTRRVARYTLSLQGEETIAWPRGEVLTERWHRQSEDGKTEAWFWLAPSLHYIPVKMRISRTSRGTLEVLLDSIRVDDADAPGSDADQPPSDQRAQDKPWNRLEPLPGPDAHGQ